MHVILTHEQADFDALASMLGAALLLENAVPVLPRRMNRNVKAFLTLYGADLPFTDPRDLPSGVVIEQVTLVDTQASVSIRGMGARTHMQVIDHHPRREGLPSEWVVNTFETGATTTVLVEQLQADGGPLTTIQATLLLMGIYEDTGSLTYTRTTPRDLNAAAFLLEQSASLRMASDFLNHPLSLAQQALYDDLRAGAEYLNIHGHTIVVARTQAEETDEELSSITHKLRDLLDPDAIFVLAATHGGVQLIARSTSDHIDVSAITAQFGGGGHERAAACLIHNQSLDEVYSNLQRVLLEVVRPAVTVAQIMSRDPHVLPPDLSLLEAQRRMQRYGYEGFPVVREGKIIGLLTRRAVDRAVAHNLHQQKYTIERIMEAGSHSVIPADSIEHVQRLVTDTGWGQIPVLDAQTHAIIGIVTRTDLLKSLTPVPQPPGSLNLAARTEAALPPERLRLLKTIAEMAYEQHIALYLVGGFVRDLLLERPSLDFDLVVEGDAILLAHALRHKYGGRVTSHSRFGTAKWRLDVPDVKLPAAGMPAIDLITARTEFYTHPTALPTVERGSIKLDLHRRDFTINTLAMRLDGRHYGELYDNWGGLEDLHAGLVRVLHSLSFVDDPTRILRAVRFEARFAFQIEARTMQLLLEARPLIERLSGDRIRHELNHILAGSQAAPILARLNALGLLSTIHPDLCWDEWLFEQFEALNSLQPAQEWCLSEEPSVLKRDLAYILWLIRLSPEQAEKVQTRLKLPASLETTIQAACRLWQDRQQLACASPNEAVNRLENIPPLARFALYRATSDDALHHVLLQTITKWQNVQPFTNGDDLKAMHIPPGPFYRQVLEALRTAWLDERIHSEEEEKHLLVELLAEAGQTNQ
jgi:tRNA nucleotidyltransferase (CCA-adding enzyme)